MKNCPNCGIEFSEKREKAFHCESCGWLTEIDGQWHPCQEPAVIVDPDPPKAEPKPEPEPERTASTLPVTQVKSLFGGLVTVTEIEDDEDV